MVVDVPKKTSFISGKKEAKSLKMSDNKYAEQVDGKLITIPYHPWDWYITVYFLIYLLKQLSM